MKGMCVLAAFSLLLPANCLPQPADGGVAALKAEADKALSAWRTEVREARKAEKPQSEWPQNPIKDYWPKFQEIAEKQKGSAEAGEALTWMLAFAGQTGISRDELKETASEIVDTLLESHVDQPCMSQAVATISRMGYALGDKTEPAIRKILEKNKQDSVRPQALIALATCLAGDDESADKERRAEAKKCLVELTTKFAATDAGKRAAPMLFELEHLGIGMQAPDFAAEDVEGAKFKLSDYRGKVVVLDFWGFW